jgi:hypothetical protein
VRAAAAGLPGYLYDTLTLPSRIAGATTGTRGQRTRSVKYRG